MVALLDLEVLPLAFPEFSDQCQVKRTVLLVGNVNLAQVVELRLSVSQHIPEGPVRGKDVVRTITHHYADCRVRECRLPSLLALLEPVLCLLAFLDVLASD